VYDAPSESTSNAEDEGNDATKAAVALAEDLGVDLSTVSGSGQGGKVTVPDVQAAAEAKED
jgi:pyruvate/2-oxoglutarate dehydrogenase complex dihydrolipoamide acyltransferase (E2) component